VQDTPNTPAEAEEARHARAIPTVEERISHIVGMMERFEWDRGRSAPKLAAEWGLSVSTVEKHSQEASRRCTADPDEVRRDIAIGGRKLLRKAIRDEDDKAFKNVAEVLASVSGAKAPEQRIITSAASPTEAARLVREAFGENATPKAPELNGHSKNGHANGTGSVPPATGR
jgi:hypothetical protein